VADRLVASPGVTQVAAIHCETTNRIVNPIDECGAIVAGADALFIVSAMSSFGAIPVDLAAARIDFLISSANQCIEGVPGFVLARRSRLLEARARSTLSLDLHVPSAAWSPMASSASPADAFTEGLASGSS